MIKRYSEPRLTLIVIVSVIVLTTVYMVIGVIPSIAVNNGYGILPTFAVGKTLGNSHTFNSLLFFEITCFCEGVIIAVMLNKLRHIKREFSMLNELFIFAFLWLSFTNLALWLIIQG